MCLSFIQALLHEDASENGGIAPRILILGPRRRRRRRVVSFTERTLLSLGNFPPKILRGRKGGTQSWSGSGSKNKNLCFSRELDRVLLVHSLLSIITVH
jgi:hypothetical protein